MASEKEGYYSSNTITLNVSFRGQLRSCALASTSTLSELQDQIYAETNVPPSLQKLLYKGKKAGTNSSNAQLTLGEAGLRDKMRVQLVGSTEEELGGMKAAEDEKRRRDEILRARAARAPPKVQSRSSPSTISTSYRFHSIVPLAHLPEPSTATTFLRRLADDPAIQHVMQVHRFSVGTLTELAPHEQPHLLGLNVNSGQAIKLRIRTDAYDGFRKYGDVRRVLCHELTHNVWGDHDNNFKALNSQLNKEVTEFERSAREGSRTLGGSGPVYTPSDIEVEAHEYMLGTASGSTGQVLINTPEERRRRALEAAVSRLRQEEAELENGCGTAGIRAGDEETVRAVNSNESQPQERTFSESS